MKKLLLLALAIVLCCIQLKAQTSQQAIADLALISGNVKYYYPNKTIKPDDWNKLSAYIIQSWQIDSHTIKPPQDILKNIKDKYTEMGLDVNLYRYPPPINTYQWPTAASKGKHWEYVGYGYSKNKYMLGPFAWAYNLFANPYSKALKRNTAAYYKTADLSNDLSFTNAECYVQLHDSLWLGMPLNGAIHKQSEAFKNFKASEDEYALNYSIPYLMDVWNVLYHFCPTVEPKNIWLQRLDAAVSEVSAGSSLYNEVDKLTAYTNDAHINMSPTYLTPGIFSKVNATIYYKEPSTDTSSGKLWEVLFYQGEKASKIYNENLAMMASPGKEAKSYLALRRMRAWADTGIIKLQVRDMANGKEQTLSIERIAEYNDPAMLYSHGKSVVIDSAKGIHYMDLKKVGSSKIVRTLKSDKCKGLIIDMRGHGYVGNKLMQLLISEKCTRVHMVTPRHMYPEKILLSYDTIIEYINPAKRHIEKPIVLLCDESSISSSETILATLQDCSDVVVIGRQTAGTTGNAVIAPIYYANGKYSITPFTPTLALDKTGNRMNGIVPDIYITKTLENIQHNEDEIFDAAKKYLQQETK